MAITLDETWISGLDGRSHVRQVYRGDETIGRVRRRREEEPGELSGERFTAERMKGALYELIEGTQATFEEALERLVMYGVAQ